MSSRLWIGSVLAASVLALAALTVGGPNSTSIAGTDPAHSSHDHAAESKAKADAHDHGEAKAAPAPALPAGVNAVQNEMRQLNEAWVVINNAVINNTLAVIPEALHKVHTARDLTLEAIEKGQYKLPKNADKMSEFLKQDEAFHDELVKLLRASRANDLPAATRQVGTILNGCTDCHMKYRFK